MNTRDIHFPDLGLASWPAHTLTVRVIVLKVQHPLFVDTLELPANKRNWRQLRD